MDGPRGALIGVALAALAGCSTADLAARPKLGATSPRLAALAWIVGDWEGTSDEGGAMDEHWIAARGNSILGVSREVKGGKLVSYELLRIEDRGDAVVLVPMPNGRPPHEFDLARVEGTRAVFESRGGDRIRRITYAREGAMLTARLEGEENGHAINWVFRYRASPAAACR